MTQKLSSTTDRQAFAPLLRCPKCRQSGRLVAQSNNDYACSACGFGIHSIDGIVDFVAGGRDTQLDVSVYDNQKGVDIEGSRALFAHIKRHAGGAIGDHLGDVFEIGAGTGFLTIGMLKESTFDRALITDISLNMLALCKSRVLASQPGDGALCFATYSDDTVVIADAAFDLCISNSVLHHIADYQAFLATVRTLLKAGGKAVFVEPSLLFHECLSRAMSDTLSEMLATGHVGSEDARKSATFIHDVRYRLTLRDSAEILALEDKHMFTREALTSAAFTAGYSSVEMFPNRLDNCGQNSAAEYLRELDVSEAFRDEFLNRYPRYAKYLFRGLDDNDHSGMYVCAFTK